MYYKTSDLVEKFLTLCFLWLFSVTALFAQNLVGGKRVKQGAWENRQIEYIEGEISVILKAGMSKNDILPLLQKHGATIKRDFNKLGWGLIELPASNDVLSTALELKHSPLLKAAEPNQVHRAQGDPNDPFFLDGHQWALWNWGQNPPGGTSGADIKVRNAWEITRGSSSIIIAVLDSGIPLVSGSLSHPDLDDPNKFILGGDFIDVPADGVRDNFGHGTHVTGIIAAETDNGEGIAGVAGNCRVLAIQVFDAFGFGSDAAFASGVYYAVDNGAKVINYSGGGSSPSFTLEQAVQYAKSNNVVLIASAGNSCGGPVLYPAAYSATHANTIAVSATNHQDVIAEYSSVGPEVNVSAPGGHGTTNRCQTGYIYFDSDDIYSTTPNYPFSIQIGHPEVTQNYGYLAGTSMAAPHVSEVAALILSISPTLTPTEVRDILQKTANDKGPAGFDNVYGHGRINAYQALPLALAYGNRSMFSTATAGNNGRRLARSSGGIYHLVFESGVTIGGQDLREIFYRNSFDYGVTWNAPVRLSNGLSDGVKTNPSIYERAGYVYVVWQKNTGSSSDITFHKSIDGGATWPTSNRKTLATGVGANPPLPVVVSPATNQLLVVYRTATNLSYRTSSNYGNTWNTAAAVPSSGASGNSPTLAVTTTSSTPPSYPRTVLVNAATGGNGAIFYRYYIHEGDSAGWEDSLLKNLSIIVPGIYTGHQKPSLAPSGTATSTTLHVAWEARIASTNESVILHRKATNWSTWPSIYELVHYSTDQQQLPSITGLANNSAELLSQSVSQNNINKIHYNGTDWDIDMWFVASGTNPSVSIGNTAAKYVWTSGSAAPYQINTSSETLMKTNSRRLTTAYHRSIAIVDTTTRNWLEVRLDKLAVKTKAGEEFAIPFAKAKEDANSLTPASAFTNLASSSITLPADAESLFVRCQVNGEGLSAIKKRDTAINVEIALSKKNGETIKLPVINTSSEGLAETKRTIAIAASNFAGKEFSLRTHVSGIDNKSSLIASLGHIYEIVETPVGKVLSSIAESAAPQNYALSAYPNPFSANGTFGNPSTQIHFAMKEAGRVSVRIYNLSGQLIRELLNDYRVAGEHTLPWDGHDNLGAVAASGVYFIRFEAGNAVKVNKVMLVR